MEASAEITVEGNETPTPEESPEEKTGGDPSSGQEEMARASIFSSTDGRQYGAVAVCTAGSECWGDGDGSSLGCEKKYARIYGGK